MATQSRRGGNRTGGLMKATEASPESHGFFYLHHAVPECSCPISPCSIVSFAPTEMRMKSNMLTPGDAPFPPTFFPPTWYTNTPTGTHAADGSPETMGKDSWLIERQNGNSRSDLWVSSQFDSSDKVDAQPTGLVGFSQRNMGSSRIRMRPWHFRM